MVKSIIKRVIVAVSVALILGYIGSLTGFIVPINVYAKEPIIGINGATTSTEPVKSNGLTSNVFYEPNSTFDFYYYQFAIAPSDSTYCTDEYCYKMSNPTPSFYHNHVNDNHTIEISTGGSIPSNERYTYISTNYTTFNNALQLHYNNHYTYLIVFEIDPGVSFTSSDRDNFTISAINISPNYSSLTSYNIVNDVENLYSVYRRMYDSENDSYYAYIQVDFNLPTLQYSDIYLTDIWIEYDNYSSNPVDVPIDYLMYARSDTYHNFTTNVYFLENAKVDFYGGQLEGYDYYGPEDVAVLDSIEICADTDIICHIRRVFDMIYKFFVRISNFFKDLFNDSVVWDLDNNSDMTPVSSLLTMPLTLINAFITGFNSTCSSFTLGTLYNYTLVFPCLNLEQTLGSTIWAIIDLLCSGFMCFNIGRLIITFFDKSTSLDDMFSLMYHNHDYNIREQYQDWR